MDIAEDRGRFSDMLKELGIPYPRYGTAYTTDEAIEVAHQVRLPGTRSPQLCIRRTAHAYRFE